MNILLNLPRIEHELNTDKKMQSRKSENEGGFLVSARSCLRDSLHPYYKR